MHTHTHTHRQHHDMQMVASFHASHSKVQLHLCTVIFDHVTYLKELTGTGNSVSSHVGSTGLPSNAVQC